MAVSSSTVVAPVHGYHACMDQWKAKIDTVLFFECALVEYVIIEGVRVCIRCFITPMTLND